jgi:MFS family permease
LGGNGSSITPLYEQPEVHDRRWFLLGVLCLSLTLVVMAVSGLNTALPTIQQDLDASPTVLQWIIDAYALVFAGLLLTAGALGDRYGRKGALLVGLVVFAGGALVSGLANSSGVVIAGRALQGVGAAFAMPATLSLITAIFPPEERARAIAVWVGFAGAGGAIGPVVSGALLDQFWSLSWSRPWQSSARAHVTTQSHRSTHAARCCRWSVSAHCCSGSSKVPSADGPTRSSWRPSLLRSRS